MAEQERIMSLEELEANERESVRKMVEELPKQSIFSRVFINRPRFAVVIALVMSIVGVIAIRSLPIAQYPEVTPPSVSVSCTYPGANAVDLANSVAIPIESAVNGVEDMLYMSSSCTDSGRYRLNVTFAVGTDRDIAQVRVQNRVAQAESKLPKEVTQQGVNVETRSDSTLGFISFRSPSGELSKLEISDFLYSNVRDAILRVHGVGGADVHGARMAMRIWLDPERLAAQGLDASDVISAIEAQNLQAALGSVGASPVLDVNVRDTFSIIAQGRLSTVREFEDIVVRSADEGGLVRVRDIARVELGEQSYSNTGYFNGLDAVSMGIEQTPGTNAIEAMRNVRKTLKDLEPTFPGDLEYTIAYDSTEFVQVSIDEIIKTLIETFVHHLPLRPRPGHRLGRRRRHRRGRARPAPHGQEQARPQDGHPALHARGDRPGRRHHPGVARHLRARRLRRRHHRPHLLPVRRHHVDGHPLLGRQRPHPLPGHLRHHPWRPQAAHQMVGPLHVVQPRP